MSTKRLSLGIALCLVLVHAPAAPGATRRAARPAVTCQACLAIDEEGRVLYTHNAAFPLPNASTTKMVTALLVREEADLSEEVRISQTAASVGGGGLDLQPGGGFDVEELLLALLLTSSNDASVALAEHVSGSEAAFVEAMNERARASGWEGTSFVTPHGLDRPGHVSTAEDLAAIAQELLEDPVLAAMVARSKALVHGPEGAMVLDNRNLLLEGYPGAIGVKTGFTALAGNVLVAAARRSGRTVTAVAMHSVDATSDAAELLDHGFALLRRTVMVQRGDRFGALLFEGTGSTGIVAGRPIRGLVPPDRLSVVFVPGRSVSLPVESGESVGVLRVRDQRGRAVARVEAVAESSVDADEGSLAQRALTTLMRGVASVFGSA